MNKKIFALPMFALLASLLPGCIVDSATEIEDTMDAPAAAPESAQLDRQIATLEVVGGKVIFVDEGDGIAFWEIGNVNLTSLLDGANASALEVFLALAPQGTPVPTRLVEHHAEVVARIDTMAAEPRNLAPMFVMSEVQHLTNEGLNRGGSDSAPNCWGWGGTTNNYDPETGYSNFSLSSFQSGFINNYSQITGGLAQVSNGAAIRNSTSNGYVTTSLGHERAMAFCASKAVLHDAQGNCDHNRVYAFVDVSRTDENGNYVGAGAIYIDQFGEGARFRSNYTNSGGTARKYTATVTFYTHEYEYLHGADTISCEDQMAIVWRSKYASGTISQ